MKLEIKKISNYMAENHIDFVYVPMTDFHNSEYTHDHFKFLRHLTGFTGSAAELLITRNGAYMWTDGRYFLQGEMQLKGSGITLMKSGEVEVPTIMEFMQSQLSHISSDANSIAMALDGRLIHYSQYKSLQDFFELQGKKLKRDYRIIDLPLSDLFWTERPPLSSAPIWKLPLEVTGSTCENKLSKLRYALAESRCKSIVLTKLDHIAWLFNLRGADIADSPLFYSFAIVTDRDSCIFTLDDLDKVKSMVPDETNCRDYYEFFSFIEETPLPLPVQLDDDSISISIVKAVEKNYYKLMKDQSSKPSKALDDAPIRFLQSPVSIMKSIKNSVEIASTKRAHIKDGVAMVNFLFRLNKELKIRYNKKTGLPKDGYVPLSELEIGQMVKRERAMQDGFITESFSTIAGYNENGAVVHYSATPESSKDIKLEGMLLLDSGGHYNDGTTDITRTIPMGPCDDEMKRAYTAVLKAHIALEVAEFKENPLSLDLDNIPRNILKSFGYEYNHGTGHGVGHILVVHEGPNAIRKSAVPSNIRKGTITTDEPGVYLEGRFGIRLENELLAVASSNGKLKFESLTLCPFSKELTDLSLLDDDEIKWLKDYHSMVYKALSPHLKKEVASYLRKLCNW